MGGMHARPASGVRRHGRQPGPLRKAVNKSITWRYLIALALIALLSTGAFFGLFLTLKTEEKHAAVLQEVARQQAASQRLAFFANAYAGASSVLDREDYHREFARSIRAMERSHKSMLEGELYQSLVASEQERLHELFFTENRLSTGRSGTFSPTPSAISHFLPSTRAKLMPACWRSISRV